MAKTLLAGFVKGFSDTAVRGLEARQEEERERRKIELLNRLQRETEEEMMILRDKMERRKPSKEQSQVDLERGIRVNRNEYGDVVGEVPLTPSELEAHRLSLEGARLGVEDTRSTIASRARDDARQDRSTDAYIRSLESGSDRGTARGERGNKILLAEADRVFGEMEEIVNPAAMAQFRAKFYEGVNDKGWSERQQRTFLREMQRRATRRWSMDGKEMPSLMQAYPLETRIPQD